VQHSFSGLSSPQPVRDLWQRKGLGAFNDGYTVPVHWTGTLKLPLYRRA